MREENTKIVIDASYVLSLLLPDEKNDDGLSTLKQYQNGSLFFLASPILPFEVINGVKSAVVSKRISSSDGIQLVNDFQSLSIEYPPLHVPSLLTFALDHNLSVYDASYILLAQNMDIPFLTLDKNLKKIQENK